MLMENLEPNYIVGLVDGEGSFTVHIPNPERRKQVKRRARAEPRFYIKLAEKDKKILDRVRKFFGCGNVYFQKDTRENHQDCYRYEVANRRDLQKTIIPFFKDYPLKMPSKRKDFEIFCELLQLIEEGVHLTDKGLESLYKIKQKMH